MKLIIAIVVIAILISIIWKHRKVRDRLWDFSDKIDAELYARRILSLNSFRNKRKKDFVLDLALVESMIRRFDSLIHDQPYDDKTDFESAKGDLSKNGDRGRSVTDT